MSNIVGNIFDRNPKSYQMLRKLIYEKNKGLNFLKLMLCLPKIPRWNKEANDQVKLIKDNGSIFKLPDKKTLFYLPNLDMKIGEFIQNRIFLEENYFENRNLEIVKKYINEGDIICDIGANIGNHTLYFVNECSAKKVYCFEPVEETFTILKRNVEINDVEDKVKVYNVALGAESGKGSIIKNNVYDSGSNQVRIEECEGNVNIITLDQSEIFEKVNFIKIDVEGFEYDVLKGAYKIIKRDTPVIFIEILKENFQKVDKLLEGYGYKCIHPLDNDYIYMKCK